MAKTAGAKKKAAPKKTASEPKLPKGLYKTAKLVKKMSVTRGRIVRVFNQNKKTFANPDYLMVWMQDGKGKWNVYAFTDREIKAGLDRAKKNKEDLTKLSFITDLPDTPAPEPNKPSPEPVTGGEDTSINQRNVEDKESLQDPRPVSTSTNKGFTHPSREGAPSNDEGDEGENS